VDKEKEKNEKIRKIALRSFKERLLLIPDIAMALKNKAKTILYHTVYHTRV